MRSFIRVPLAIATAVALCPALALAQVPPPPSGGAAAQPAPVAAPAAPAEMSEEEKTTRARDLYSAAEAAYAAGDYVTATQKYEEAYYLVPGKHGFAYKVGLSAWAAGDCVKADEYMRHYTTYGDDGKHPEWIDEAKRIMGEIALQGCAQGGAAPVEEPAPITGPAPTAEEEAPILTSRSSEREEEAAKARRDAAAGKKSGLFKGGMILMSVGAGLAIGGGVCLIIANKNANTLADLSSNATNTGFPKGDYTDTKTYNMDRNITALNIVAGAGMGVGGLALVGGIVMLVVDKKKSGGGTNAKANGPQLTGLGPALLPRGAGASATLRF
jgi:hypothetical protein